MIIIIKNTKTKLIVENTEIIDGILYYKCKNRKCLIPETIIKTKIYETDKITKH